MFHPDRIKFMPGKTALLVLAFSLAGLIGCGGDVAGPGPTPNPTLPAATVTLSAPTVTIRFGTPAAVSANLRDAAGNSLSGRTIAWTSSDPLVATVRSELAQSATIDPVGLGEVTVTASVDGVTATLTFAVTPRAAPLGQIRGFLYSASEGFSEILAIPSGSAVLPADLNDAGQVVGSVNIGRTQHAFLWTRDGGMTDLGVPAGWERSVATAVNSNGIVVGNVTRGNWPGQESRAFRWSSTTGMVILPLPGNSLVGVATDINTQGDIIGHTRADQFAAERPVRWSSTGTVEEIGNPKGESGGDALAINDKGQVAGLRFAANSRYNDYFYTSTATFWDTDGTVTNLGGCGEECGATANAINESGQLTGIIGNNAFHWSKAEGLTSLGTGAGSTYSTGDGINSIGQVIVNRYYGRDIPPRAFLWSRSAGIRDIGVLTGTVSSRAAAINNKGQIVGYAQ